MIKIRYPYDLEVALKELEDREEVQQSQLQKMSQQRLNEEMGANQDTRSLLGATEGNEAVEHRKDSVGRWVQFITWSFVQIPRVCFSLFSLFSSLLSLLFFFFLLLSLTSFNSSSDFNESYQVQL